MCHLSFKTPKDLTSTYIDIIQCNLECPETICNNISINTLNPFITAVQTLHKINISSSLYSVPSASKVYNFHCSISNSNNYSICNQRTRYTSIYKCTHSQIWLTKLISHANSSNIGETRCW